MLAERVRWDREHFYTHRELCMRERADYLRAAGFPQRTRLVINIVLKQKFIPRCCDLSGAGKTFVHSFCAFF